MNAKPASSWCEQQQGHQPAATRQGVVAVSLQTLVMAGIQLNGHFVLSFLNMIGVSYSDATVNKCYAYCVLTGSSQSVVVIYDRSRHDPIHKLDVSKYMLSECYRCCARTEV